MRVVAGRSIDRSCSADDSGVGTKKSSARQTHDELNQCSVHFELSGPVRSFQAKFVAICTAVSCRGTLHREVLSHGMKSNLPEDATGDKNPFLDMF